MDPLKYIFQKPMPTGRLAKWQILLIEFDIIYITRTAMKAQALEDQRTLLMKNMNHLKPIFQMKRYLVSMKLFTITIKVGSYSLMVPLTGKEFE